jgi:hypothetical protein
MGFQYRAASFRLNILSVSVARAAQMFDEAPRFQFDKTSVVFRI